LSIPPLVVFLRWNRLPGNPPCILRWRVTLDLLLGLFMSFLGLGISLYILSLFIGNLGVFVVSYLLVVLWNLALMMNIGQIPLWNLTLITLVLLGFLFSWSHQWTLIPNSVMHIY